MTKKRIIAISIGFLFLNSSCKKEIEFNDLSYSELEALVDDENGKNAQILVSKWIDARISDNEQPTLYRELEHGLLLRSRLRNDAGMSNSKIDFWTVIGYLEARYHDSKDPRTLFSIASLVAKQGNQKWALDIKARGNRSHPEWKAFDEPDDHFLARLQSEPD